MSTAFTVATSATQLNCIILLPLDGSNPDSSQLNRKPMGAELSKPLTSNVLKSFKLPEQNRRRLWHWMRMPLTFKCPMCDQWVYKFMCFAGYVQVVLLHSSISIYLYNFIYRYMPLSLSLYSLLYLWRSPSLTKPLRFGLFGWRPWPVPWHPPRAAGPQGLRGLAAFRATQHVTTYINTSIHIAIEGVWAASTLPVAKGPRCSFSNSLYLRVLEPALVRTVNQYIGMPEHIEADTKKTGPHWCTQHPAQLPCPQRGTYWIGFPRLWIEYGACAGALKRCCSSFDQFLRIACSR